MKKKRAICLVTTAILAIGSAVPAMAATKQAVPSTSKVSIDGKSVSMTAYTIDGYTYFKLRDVAAALKNTDMPFAVGYDAATKSITMNSYTRTATNFANSRATQKKSASLSNQKVLLDGKKISMQAYLIDGNNYFKLRDIGDKLGFEVGWDAAKQTITLTTEVPKWKTLYQNVLQSNELYSNDDSFYRFRAAYLIDVDGNGIPELYLISGQSDEKEYISAIYDASSGKLKKIELDDYEQRFGVTSIVKHKSTGERWMGIRWRISGAASYYDVVKPDFNTLTLKSNQLIADEWAGNKYSDYGSDQYVDLVKVEDMNEEFIYCNEGEKFSKTEVKEFLGIPDKKAIVTETVKEVKTDWVVLYKDYIINKHDWEFGGEITLRKTDGSDIPTMYIGTGAMSDIAFYEKCTIKNGKVVVESLSRTLYMPKEDMDNLSYDEIYKLYYSEWDGPTAKEVENFLKKFDSVKNTLHKLDTKAQYSYDEEWMYY